VKILESVQPRHLGGRVGHPADRRLRLDLLRPRSRPARTALIVVVAW
jgi:hypothetical protein